MIDSPSHRAWNGYAFEQLCLHHISQIKKKLGILGVQTNVYSWQQKANKEKGIEGAQIDLILDRRDQIINLCEMKDSLKAYDITPVICKNCWTEEKSSDKHQIPARHCI